MAAIPEAANTTLKLLEALTLPPHAGDCVVLILMHPGHNALSRFFPSSRMNDLLLAGTSPQPTDEADMLLDPPVESKPLAESESWDAMDIATFLECVGRVPAGLERGADSQLQIRHRGRAMSRGHAQVRTIARC